MGMTSTTAAAPCRLCGTTEGWRHTLTGEPNRTRNLCEACYIRERRAGRLDRWPKRERPRRVPLVAHTCAQCGKTFHAYAARHRTYCSHHCQYASMGVERPATIPTGIVTPAMLGIAPHEIADRCAEAAYELALETAEALYRGDNWRIHHPAQFAPEALAKLYPDPAGLACSAWAEDAARRAA